MTILCLESEYSQESHSLLIDGVDNVSEVAAQCEPYELQKLGRVHLLR